MIEQERTTAEHVLVLDAGDTLIGDRWPALESQGAVIVEAMELMGYDAMALGERDLQLGPEALRLRKEEAAFPFLSANLELDGELFATPYVVREVDGHRVAIIGLTGLLPGPVQGFQTNDPVQAAREVLADLPEGVDIIILVAHVGIDMEMRLRDEVPGIDVIVGGSSQWRMASALWDEESGVLMLPSEQPSTGHAGRLLGEVKLQFDSSGRLTGHASQLVSLGPDIADHPAQLELLQRYQDMGKQ